MAGRQPVIYFCTVLDSAPNSEFEKVMYGYAVIQELTAGGWQYGSLQWDADFLSEWKGRKKSNFLLPDHAGVILPTLKKRTCYRGFPPLQTDERLGCAI